MAISEKVFPEGDLQNIIATSPTQKDYNIRATKDLVDQLPGGVLKDVLAPAAAGVLSIPYDAIQAATRMLFYKVDTNLWAALKTFLVYLNYLPETMYQNINIDLSIAKKLKDI